MVVVGAAVLAAIAAGVASFTGEGTRSAVRSGVPNTGTITTRTVSKFPSVLQAAGPTCSRQTGYARGARPTNPLTSPSKTP